MYDPVLEMTMILRRRKTFFMRKIQVPVTRRKKIMDIVNNLDEVNCTLVIERDFWRRKFWGKYAHVSYIP
ncbi:unnamed protein product, partial [Linum tenue]